MVSFLSEPKPIIKDAVSPVPEYCLPPAVAPGSAVSLLHEVPL